MILRFGRDVGHAGIEIHRADGVADRLILLAGRQVALVVLRAAAARIEQELGESDVRVAAVIAFLIVDEAAETHQRLLHLLVTVEPLLLARTDVRDPAVGQFLRGVVQAKIFAVGQRVVIDRGFDEVAGDIAFMIAAMIGRPALRPILAIGQNIGGLQVAIRHLRGEDDRNPALQRRAHQLPAP